MSSLPADAVPPVFRTIQNELPFLLHYKVYTKVYALRSLTNTHKGIYQMSG